LAEKFVDFAAVGRVANRVELKVIRVTDISAKSEPKVAGTLEPTLDLDCTIVSRESNTLEVACNYRFTAQAAGAQVAEATIRYLLVFEVQGSDPLIEADLSEFATANGTLHSWPFVREFLYGLTSKMGYAPYTLPVFHFKPKPEEKKQAEPIANIAQESSSHEPKV